MKKIVFPSSPSYTLQEIAKILKVELRGDPQLKISGVNDLDSAKESDVSFFSNPRYEQAMKKSQAGAIVISNKQDLQEEIICQKNFLIAEDPSRTFQELVELFSNAKKEPSAFLGIHSTAVIHESAQIEEGVTCGPYVVVDANAHIGKNSFIGCASYIGMDVKIGNECVIHPQVVIREGCIIGNRVVIQPGAIIGSCGFGFTTDKNGCHSKLNQVGTVIIEDDVEIGANTTIDRARFQATTIGEGSKIDNLVQIGHGVIIGKHNFIIAQTGIAGSTETGKHVILAGQVAVNGHIKLGDGVVVSARSGVSKSLLKAGKYGGVPAMPLADYNRMAVHLQNIENLVQEHKLLKKKILELLNLDSLNEEGQDISASST